jgi:hypothetical protein
VGPGCCTTGNGRPQVTRFITKSPRGVPYLKDGRNGNLR